MKYLVFDFDGTITTRDTTRLLIYELLRLRPYKLPFIAFILAKLLFKRTPELIQTSKNKCIGTLVKGLTLVAVKPYLVRFSNSVSGLYRHELIDTIEENISIGNKVVIASASPAFVLEYLFSGYDVTVIATKFNCNGKIFSGSTEDGSCFGENKAKAVQEFFKMRGENVVIECAWSDSISDLPVMMMAKTRVWYCSAVDESLIRQADPEGSIVRSS